MLKKKRFASLLYSYRCDGNGEVTNYSSIEMFCRMSRTDTGFHLKKMYL